MSSTAALTENGSEKSQILIQRIIWGLTAIFLHRKEMSWKTSHLAEEPVTVEGRECYQMYGDVKGEDLMGLLGRDMISAFGLVDLPSEEAVKELDVPVIFDIYKEELLPARIIVDMSGVLGDLYDSYGETTKVNLYSIELVFTEYDQVEEITVPQEVKDAC